MRADDQDKSAPIPGAGTQPADKVFLGPEFLTWLYFHLEDQGFAIEVGGEEVRFAIGKRTVLKVLDSSGARITIAGPDLDDSGELLHAVRRGALIDILALQMVLGERVYDFSLSGSDGGITLKVPDLFSTDDEKEPIGFDDEKPKRPRPKPRQIDAADVLDLRMLCLDDVEGVLDDLFRRFLTRRLARAWHSEDLSSMRATVATRLKGHLPRTG
jgi:hypothetical protein